MHDWKHLWLPTLIGRVIVLVGTLILLIGCEASEPAPDPLLQILASEDPAIARVMQDPDKYEIQIHYTRISRMGDSVGFTDYTYRIDKDRYFYPASTVKFPIAVAALEKLNTLDSVDRDYRYYIEGDSVENTFAEDIEKIFAVSDNHASNRLIEFLGQNEINSRITDKKAGPIRISHRLGYHREDLTTQPLVVYLNDSLTTLTSPIVNSAPQPLDLIGISKGNGYYSGDSLILEPFDFGLKNYLPIQTLHGVLQRVIFPEAFPPEARCQISEEQREFLLTTMKTLPRLSGYPQDMYPDGYCKFFIYGDSEETIPDSVEIYNKVGFAYGTLTDCAYIRDTEKGIEFMLTATILVNENGVFNDDKYEYDEIGIPFLASLGREVYAYELQQLK
ncbi:MAG: serine hydrolase [Robiginitalea sp.]|uniref:serine hydrolase n=1 Tax=Robiginitalea sp. TaxID=1902411 RepID=UPI003C73EEAC